MNPRRQRHWQAISAARWGRFIPIALDYEDGSWLLVVGVGPFEAMAIIPVEPDSGFDLSVGVRIGGVMMQARAKAR